MKKSPKLMTFLMNFSFIFVLILGLSACQSQNPATIETESTPQLDPQYEFAFDGSATYENGRNYNITIYGNKDAEQTVFVKVKELPYAELTGTWVMDEGKGYKIFFNDDTGTFAYSYYDPESGNFTITYDMFLGTVAGTQTVQFTFVDPDFKDSYDGVGLGKMPPIFKGVGYFAGNPPRFSTEGSQIFCRDDGTCVFTQTEWPTLYTPRNGTWSYDEANNEYHFVFEPEALNSFAPDSENPNDVKYKNNYCSTQLGNAPQREEWTYVEEDEPLTYDEFTAYYIEETGTYCMVAEMFCVEYIERYLTYTPVSQ